MLEPKIIAGNLFKDHRGAVLFNNNFDASRVKRIYIIENKDLITVRAWQGHRIEQKWMAPVSGKFKISIVKINLSGIPDKDSEILEFIVSAESLDVLHIPAGFANSIQAMEPHSKLLVMADYYAGEVSDELRFENNYFNNFSPSF